MNELEKTIKDGFEVSMGEVRKDFEADRTPFMTWLQPLLDILSGLAFFVYQRGFEDGMVYKENNESKDVQ